MPKPRTQKQKEQQHKADAKRKGERTRNWMFIMYPDSAPENWRDILNDQHVQIAVSPLHDRDVNATGEPKKPHWHVVLAYESVKTKEQVQEVADALNATEVKKVQSLSGMLRYLTHMDNPEKAQYDKDDIISFGGMDVQNIILTSSDKVLMLEQIMNWIDENHCTKFTMLMRYCRTCKREWFEMLATGYTLVITAYIKDMWREEKETEARIHAEIAEAERAEARKQQKGGADNG